MAPNPALPLSRYTVLDLTRARAGPTCVRQLVDWGATAIKIEMPGGRSGDGMGGNRHGFDFQNLHRNKKAMTLNLRDPEGVKVFKELAKKADIVVENYRPDVKRRLGIDYEDLKPINPRLIYGSISGFGQSGPYRDRPGVDQIAQGMGGLMSITGIPGQGPVRVGIPIADLCSGILLAQGILVALIERETTGQGKWVHTSLLEAMLSMLDFQASRWLMSKEVPPQAGNNHPTGIPTGVFETKDGHINIAAAGDEIYERFCRAIERPDLRTDARFSTSKARSTNRDVLTDVLMPVTRQKTSAEWIKILNDAGVPCGPIYRIDESFADPQVQHLKMAQPVDVAGAGRHHDSRPPRLARNRAPGHPDAGARARSGQRGDPQLARLLEGPAGGSGQARRSVVTWGATKWPPTSELHGAGDAGRDGAADPDLGAAPLDVHSSRAPQRRPLAGDIRWRRDTGSDQPLCDAGIQAAGHGILVAGGSEGAHLELGVRAIFFSVPRPNDADTQPCERHVVRTEREHVLTGAQQDSQPARTVVHPARCNDRIRRQAQPVGDPRLQISIKRPVAAQCRRLEREPAGSTADANKAPLAFLHQIVPLRDATRGEPHVAAPQRGMASERQLSLRGKDANAIVRARRPRPQEEGRLAEVRPVGKRGHLRIGQRIGADHDRQRVTAQRLGCEDVNLLKRELGQGRSLECR